MNKKFFIDTILPFIIFGIIIAAYYYLNSNQNSFSQLGGAPKSGYPKGTPKLYQFRYIIYLTVIFLIFFNILYGIEYSKIQKLTIFDNGIAFFKSFAERQSDIKKGIYKKQSPEYIENDKYIKSLKVDFLAYSDLFCKAFAPCSCCGLGKFADTKDPTTSVVTPHPDCVGVPKAIP